MFLDFPIFFSISLVSFFPDPGVLLRCYCSCDSEEISVRLCVFLDGSLLGRVRSDVATDMD